MSDSEERSESAEGSDDEDLSEGGSGSEASEEADDETSPVQLAASVARVFGTGEAMRFTLSSISDALRAYETLDRSRTGSLSSLDHPAGRALDGHSSMPLPRAQSDARLSSAASEKKSLNAVSMRACGRCGRSKLPKERTHSSEALPQAHAAPFDARRFAGAPALLT
jgi:hypothetical protein